MMKNTTLQGHVLEMLRQLPDGSAHAIVTSPPYWNLRDYGTEPVKWPAVRYSIMGFTVRVKPMVCELGQEPSHFDFIGHMVLVFREAMRVLRPDGTLWLNMGDCYAGSGKGSATHPATNGNWKQGPHNGSATAPKRKASTTGMKVKDLVGIPWMLAFALRDDGWYLRQENIWSKPNPMPESVTDRTTRSHEHIFMFSKRPRYYYDAEAVKTMGKNPEDDVRRIAQQSTAVKSSPDTLRNGLRPRGAARPHQGFNERWDAMPRSEQVSMGANKRSVWEVATKPYQGAHFATFPPDLIVDYIKAGVPEQCCGDCGAPFLRQVDKELVPTAKASKKVVVDARDHNADANDQGSNRAKDGHKPAHIYASLTTGFAAQCKCNAAAVGGTVLDPFSGTNTTGTTAMRLGRHYIAIEIDPKSVKLGQKRESDAMGLFATEITAK
jgi:DNA modification methylase